MVFICIPLKSKKVSGNWQHVEQLLQNTVCSIQNSSDQDYQIFICCHEIPSLNVPNREKIRFLPVDYPTPANSQEQMIDKYYKKRFMMKEVFDQGGGYVFFLDADDLIHRDLIKYVNDHPELKGFIINKGYEYDNSLKILKHAPRFQKVCGSCSIIHYSREMLPPRVVFTGYHRDNYYLFDYSHALCEELFFQTYGEKLAKIPFRAVIYTTNHGENHSVLSHNIGFRRKLIRLVTRKIKLTDISDHFALHQKISS